MKRPEILSCLSQLTNIVLYDIFLELVLETQITLDWNPYMTINRKTREDLEMSLLYISRPENSIMGILDPRYKTH